LGSIDGHNGIIGHIHDLDSGDLNDLSCVARELLGGERNKECICALVGFSSALDVQLHSMERADRHSGVVRNLDCLVVREELYLVLLDFTGVFALISKLNSWIDLDGSHTIVAVEVVHTL
jgi:hypothetical protein